MRKHSKSYIVGTAMALLGICVVISSSLVDVDDADFLLVVGKLTLVGLVFIASGVLLQYFYNVLSVVIAVEVWIRSRLYKKNLAKDRTSKACYSFCNVCEDFKTVLEVAKDSIVEQEVDLNE